MTCTNFHKLKYAEVMMAISIYDAIFTYFNVV